MAAVNKFSLVYSHLFTSDICSWDMYHICDSWQVVWKLRLVKSPEHPWKHAGGVGPHCWKGLAEACFRGWIGEQPLRSVNIPFYMEVYLLLSLICISKGENHFNSIISHHIADCQQLPDTDARLVRNYLVLSFSLLCEDVLQWLGSVIAQVYRNAFYSPGLRLCADWRIV